MCVRLKAGGWEETSDIQPRGLTGAGLVAAKTVGVSHGRNRTYGLSLNTKPFGGLTRLFLPVGNLLHTSVALVGEVHEHDILGISIDLPIAPQLLLLRTFVLPRVSSFGVCNTSVHS